VEVFRRAEENRKRKMEKNENESRRFGGEEKGKIDKKNVLWDNSLFKYQT
jgi:hypothetical protein